MQQRVGSAFVSFVVKDYILSLPQRRKVREVPSFPFVPFVVKGFTGSPGRHLTAAH